MWRWLRNLLGASPESGVAPSAAAPLPIEEPEEPPQTVVIPITDALDLHPFRPHETAEVVRSYLDEAIERRLREVRIIHGRGTGTQREIVRKVLARDSRVLAFHDAPPERGGWGATVAVLGPPAEPRPR